MLLAPQERASQVVLERVAVVLRREERQREFVPDAERHGAREHRERGAAAQFAYDPSNGKRRARRAEAGDGE